ncbi:MAG: hypothetical protein GXO22_05740 [Aquificae bacterium]|nr:hypothetical protein [Aquificota bacterium]
MEYDLVHAFFGRFGILIPLLAVFFELAGILTQKKVVSMLAGFLVLVSSIIVVTAGITGYLQYLYLKTQYTDISIYKIHMILGSVTTVMFLVIGMIRIFLFIKIVEKLVVFYMLFYVTAILINLISNEIILHRLY